MSTLPLRWNANPRVLLSYLTALQLLPRTAAQLWPRDETPNVSAENAYIKRDGLKFSYYNLDDNANCPAHTTLAWLFKPDAAKLLAYSDDDMTCCRFSDEARAAPSNVESAQGLSEFGVFVGQILWSHDTALTETMVGRDFTVSCPASSPDTSDRRFEGLARVNGTGAFTSIVTACMDGSIAYGRDSETLDLLSQRSYPYLDVDDAGFPYTTPITGIEMANPFESASMFSLGDLRGNENPMLAAHHLLWVHRHNYWVKHYLNVYPVEWPEVENVQGSYDNTDRRRIFQKARASTIMEIQSVSKEFSTAILGQEIVYEPAKQQVASSSPEVTLFAEFSHAINRLMHTQIRNDLIFTDAEGIETTKTLLDTYFDSTSIKTFGLAGVLKASLARPSLEVGIHYVESLTGTFDPNAPNMAHIDCARGREGGFASYADVRKTLFDETITTYADINPDETVQAQLRAIYGPEPQGVSNVDLYAGALAEPHAPNSALGKTHSSIFIAQMEQLMYHDALWYERPGVQRPLTPEEMDLVRDTPLSTILLQTTDLDCVQQHVMFVPSESNPIICKKSVAEPMPKPPTSIHHHNPHAQSGHPTHPTHYPHAGYKEPSHYSHHGGYQQPPQHYQKPQQHYQQPQQHYQQPQQHYQQPQQHYQQPQQHYQQPQQHYQQPQYDYQQPQYDYQQPQYDYQQPHQHYQQPQQHYQQPQQHYQQPQYDYQQPQQHYQQPQYDYQQPQQHYQQPQYDYKQPQYHSQQPQHQSQGGYQQPTYCHGNSYDYDQQVYPIGYSPTYDRDDANQGPYDSPQHAQSYPPRY